MGGTEEGERSDLSLGKEEDRRGDYARLVLSLWLVTEGAQRRASPGRDLMLTHYFYFFGGGEMFSKPVLPKADRGQATLLAGGACA